MTDLTYILAGELSITLSQDDWGYRMLRILSMLAGFISEQ